MTESQALYELMCRAPAVPEWFVPDMSGCPQKPHYPGPVDDCEPDIDGYRIHRIPMYKSKNGENDKAWGDWSFAIARYDADLKTETDRQRLLQWPSYYAREVLKRVEAT